MGQLADQIAQGIKDAMRAKDKDRLSALRDVKSKLMLEATKDGASDDVDDATTLAILSKLLKQRNETAGCTPSKDVQTWQPKNPHRPRSSRPSSPSP